MAEKNYQATGKGLQNIQLVMAKANYALPSYENMYKILADNYIQMYVSSKDSELIAEAYKTGSEKSLLSVSMLGHYIKTKINLVNTSDETKLMRFFPNDQFIYNFLQISDSKWLGKMRAFIYVGVKMNVKIPIKMQTLDALLEPTDNYGFKWRTLKHGFTLDCIKPNDFLYNDVFGNHKDCEFKIRLLSNVAIPFKELLQGKKSLEPKVKDKLKRVILHIHGGGFIAMSSSSHQGYLRKFCNEVDALIFSIDYPLAPMSKFKEVIEIIFKAYLYIQVS